MHPFSIERINDMDEACRLIRDQKLYLEDENLSHTLFVMQQHEDRERLHTPLLSAWFAFDREGVVKGCCLVAEGLGFTDGSPTVSLFVSEESRGQGMGNKLLDRALAKFPGAWGFHTPEAHKLYSRKGLDMAFFSLDTMDPLDWHPAPVGWPKP